MNRTLYDFIYDCLKKEHDQLMNLHEHGIFHVPELYLATLVGKELARQRYFGEDAKWIREARINKKLGPVDLAFETGKGKVIFEFKIRATLDAYLDDIKKLEAQPDACKKYFVSITDTWPNALDKDIRLNNLSNNHPGIIRLASPFQSLGTVNKLFKKPVNAILAIWEVPS